jgi:hypothetical protein
MYFDFCVTIVRRTEGPNHQLTRPRFDGITDTCIARHTADQCAAPYAAGGETITRPSVFARAKKVKSGIPLISRVCCGATNKATSRAQRFCTRSRRRGLVNPQRTQDSRP